MNVPQRKSLNFENWCRGEHFSKEKVCTYYQHITEIVVQVRLTDIDTIYPTSTSFDVINL